VVGKLLVSTTGEKTRNESEEAVGVGEVAGVVDALGVGRWNPAIPVLDMAHSLLLV
jgi:hypothetical protein